MHGVHCVQQARLVIGRAFSGMGEGPIAQAALCGQEVGEVSWDRWPPVLRPEDFRGRMHDRRSQSASWDLCRKSSGISKAKDPRSDPAVSSRNCGLLHPHLWWSPVQNNGSKRDPGPKTSAGTRPVMKAAWGEHGQLLAWSLVGHPELVLHL